MKITEVFSWEGDVHMDHQNDPDKGQEAKESILKGFYEALREQENNLPAPNELDSTCGVADDEFVRRFREVIRQENETNRSQGLPVTGYDYEKKASYIEYPDGRRVYGEET